MGAFGYGGLLVLMMLLCQIANVFPQSYRVYIVKIEPDPKVFKDFKHNDPYPSVATKHISGAFWKEFLKEIYYIQSNITHITAVRDERNITFGDLCSDTVLPPCINSALQYFQNNVTSLDDVVPDSTGFFVLADYIDHLISCMEDPLRYFDRTALKNPCVSRDGFHIYPHSVLNNYQERDYVMARQHQIRFTMAEETLQQEEDVRAWVEKVEKYLQTARQEARKRGVIIL